MAVPERTFGWIQDPANLFTLRKIVELFDPNSETHKDLVANRIPKLVQDPAVRNRLLTAMEQRPLAIKYADLPGRSLSGKGVSRANDPCNGIAQAVVPGQKRDYLSDWAATNFIRWAHALGFVARDPDSDTFAITSAGEQYIASSLDEHGANQHLKDAILAYPPAIRILRLLRDERHLTKFEIGKRLGFVGEKGFTTFDQELLVCELELEPSSSEKNRMRSNWEGTADKYARDIAGWMEGNALDWIRQVPKIVTAQEGTRTYQAEINHAYVITGAGLEALRRAEGTSSSKRTDKNVIYEMLATKAPGRDYLRRRRALTLRVLEDGKTHTIDRISQELAKHKIAANPATVKNDLDNFVNLGLRVEPVDQNGTVSYKLLDNIKNLFLPQLKAKAGSSEEVQKIKNRLLEKLEHVDKRYLVLLDLSVDPDSPADQSGPQDAASQKKAVKKNYTQFEIDTVSLFRHCGFDGSHLGGGDKPDGGIYTTQCADNYGLILDAKSRKKGFACEDGERDKMGRYYRENRHRHLPHKNQWWTIFDTSPQPLNTFRFLFVSSGFIGKYRDQFVHLSQYADNGLGAGISAENLLLFAEEIKSGRLSLEEGKRIFGVMRAVEPADLQAANS